MPIVSAIAFFCDDVRAEAMGTSTLVGIYPDNFEVPHFPGGLPRLTIYVRINIDPTVEYAPMSLRLVNTDSKEIDLGGIDADLVARTSTDARAAGAPITGIISRALAMPFAVPNPGHVKVILKVGQEEILCGALNFRLKASPSVSAPPPEQSPSVGQPTT
jgi:hypothetical protein